MSLKVVELNDRAITVSDDGGILLQSPGFALVEGDTVHVGESAQQLARLYPNQSYNKYWQELNLEPISHGNNFRHYADIAYAHLLDLAESAGLDGDVILAVPGNFTRQQLAIVLGLCQQCPFKVVGVVDSAVAAVSLLEPPRTTIYADIQLHQVVLTRVSLNGNSLEAGTTIQIPGVGSQSFMDRMMRMATDMFIQQCRFNPQHNATSEQQLYNALPDWLTEVDDGNLILELKAGDTLHTAKMPRDSLVASLSGHFQKINEQIMALAQGHGAKLLITPALASLPGFQASVGLPCEVGAREAIHDACLQHRREIESETGAMQLVKSLLAPEFDAEGTAAVSDADQPTHVLCRNRAVPLGGVELVNLAAMNGRSAGASALQLTIEGLPARLGRLKFANGRALFDSGEQEYTLNGESARGEKELRLGDQIRFQGSDDELVLIRVDGV